MPQLEFYTKYRLNQSQVLSADELLQIYLFQIKQVVVDGQRLSNETLNYYIRAAQDDIEDQLDIKLKKQIVYETRDFIRSDWQQWGFLQTRYPVNSPQLLEGFVNSVRQITYPTEWLSVKKGNDDLPWRNIYLVPNGSTAEFSSTSVIYSGITPHIGLTNARHIPNYWHITYCTGFDRVPEDIMNAIGKLASINVFHLLGDLILGAGIASQSIGIDGLSQSISTTSSATNAGYGSRIQGYLADLKKAIPELKAKYKGFTFTSL